MFSGKPKYDMEPSNYTSSYAFAVWETLVFKGSATWEMQAKIYCIFLTRFAVLRMGRGELQNKGKFIQTESECLSQLFPVR